MTSSFPQWAIDGVRAAWKAGRPHALPSVSLAQVAWESGWFKNLTGAYNYAGVKAMAGHPSSMHWTHEAGDPEPKYLAFRDFSGFDEFFAVHGDILEHGAGCLDYRVALQSGGVMRAVYLLGGGKDGRLRYATADAKQYGDGLASIIRAHNAMEYDR